MKPLLFHDELIWLVVLPKGKAKSEVWRRRRIWGFIRHELGTDFGPERVRGAAGAEQRRLKDSVVARRISQIFCPAKERETSSRSR